MLPNDLYEDAESLRLQPFLLEATRIWRNRRRKADVMLVIAIAGLVHGVLRTHGNLEAATTSVGIEWIVGVFLGYTWFTAVTQQATPREIALDLSNAAIVLPSEPRL
jgi:hypothetical protein